MRIGTELSAFRALIQLWPFHLTLFYRGRWRELFSSGCPQEPGGRVYGPGAGGAGSPARDGGIVTLPRPSVPCKSPPV